MPIPFRFGLQKEEILVPVVDVSRWLNQSEVRFIIHNRCPQACKDGSLTIAVHPSIHSFIYLSIDSFIYSLTHPFTPLVLPLDHQGFEEDCKAVAEALHKYGVVIIKNVDGYKEELRDEVGSHSSVHPFTRSLVRSHMHPCFAFQQSWIFFSSSFTFRGRFPSLFVPCCLGSSWT